MKSISKQCTECGGQIVSHYSLKEHDWVHDEIMTVRIKYEECSCCHSKYFGPSTITKLSSKRGQYRGNLLLKKYPLNQENWIEKSKILQEYNKNFPLEKLYLLFLYCQINNQTYVFKPSLEQYLRTNEHGLFWIGNYHENFYTKYDDFNNMLYIQQIKSINDFKIDTFINGKWYKSDLSDLKLSMTNEEFKQIKFYGYGGIIWKNGISVSNKTIWNLKKE